MADSSRKRKATFLDQQGRGTFDGNSQSVRDNLRGNLTHFLLKESNPKHNIGSVVGINVQGNALEAVKQNFQFAEWSNNTSSQLGKFPFQKDAIDKMNNCCEITKPLEAHHIQPSLFHKSPLGEILAQHNVAHNVAHQHEANKFQSRSGSGNLCMEKIGNFPSLKDGMNLGQSNVLSANPLLSVPCGSLTALEESQPRTINSEEFVHHENANAKTCILDLRKVGSSVNVEWTDKYMNAAGSRDISSVETGVSSQPSVGTEGKEAYGSYQHPKTEVRSGTSPRDTTSGFNVTDSDEGQLGSFTPLLTMPTKSSNCDKKCLEDGNLNNKAQVSEDQEMKIVDMRCESNAENAKHSSAGSPVRKPPDHRDDPSHISLKLDGKSMPHAGKVAPKIIEKLWEGSLQLNTSVNVPAVAYFKSGEKAPEFNWSKHVAVKGKVRLEAFEKYIQELPRSRNRALMVISLCWKVGSSKTGLIGMKEVAKGYKDGKKVGFAQLGPTIDLYVCPRSDTIITILAKYGFFKGMAAVEDDQDSLIGCVVWRRNRSSSNSVSKKSDRRNVTSSETQHNSPESAILRGVETRSPVRTAQDSEANHGNSCITRSAVGLHISDMRFSTLVSERDMAAESKNIQSSKDPLDVDVSFTNTIPKSAASVLDSSSPVISKLQPAAQKPDSSSLQASIGQPSKVENSIMHIVETKKPHAGLELLEHNLPGLSKMLLKAAQKATSLDDDDLPEFDFRTACGDSQLTVHKFLSCSNKGHFSNAPPIDKKVPTEGIRNICGPVPPAQPIMRPIAAANQQVSPLSTYQGIALDTHLGVLVTNKPGDPATQAPLWPTSGGKPSVLSSKLLSSATVEKMDNTAASTGADSHILHKNLWDDDDDMPEWCPPDVEHTAQSPSGEMIRAANIPSVPKTTLGKVPLVLSGPQMVSQPQMLCPPPAHPQRYPHRHQPRLLAQLPVNNTVMLPQTRPLSASVQMGPRYSPRSSPNLTLRPPSSLFEIKLNIRPVNRRGRRP
ncbi:uncharacterized protein LOC131258347 [Magnolia sinica]|uniref:uncharacterized protein LOC131258347 n=1 Tax=Magnolia sinica TaxID=86752 RepID=UPI002657BF6F|nr:uncharacterized protein LOC131258347 [Magnolia sinica]XP_058115593.1 uncharacterized protein LOC131258347 [Magnolia sinica]